MALNNKSKANQYRRGQRWQMIVDRGGPKVATCDMCGKFIGKKGHMHEIAARRFTVKNYSARKLSYHRMICSWLCPECHEQAHNPNAATKLLAHNCNLYGTVNVESAWTNLLLSMKSEIPIRFPESEDLHGKSETDSS